jgi:DNA-binding PadR family transcriptional regulator
MTSSKGEPLPLTAWIVLGVLSFPGERSGYEIKSWADRSLRFFYWSPALSQVYRELRRLEEVGYVSSTLAPQDELRNKRLYRITGSGRAALTAWAGRTPDSPPVIKHGVMLRVWLGHLLGDDELRGVLTDHIEWAEAMALEAAERERSAHGQGAWPYAELALRWSWRFYESEARLARELLGDLEELEGRLAAEAPPVPGDGSPEALGRPGPGAAEG